MDLYRLIKYLYWIFFTLIIAATIFLKDTQLLKVLLTLFVISSLVFIYLTKRKMKRVRMYIEEKDRRYTMSIEAMNGAIWEWDDKSRTVYLSNAIVRKLGVDSNKINLEIWYEYIFESDRERIKTYFDNICLNRFTVEANIHYRLRNIDGDIIHIKHIGKGRVSDGIYYLSGVVEDVTEIKMQEDLIKDNSEKYKQIIQGTKDIIYCWKVQSGEIIFDNKISEYIPVEVTGTEVIVNYGIWHSIIHSDDVVGHKRFIEKFLVSNSDEFYEAEYRVVNHKNEIKWIHSKGKKVVYEDGLVYVYGSLTDITDRKEKELKIHFMSYYDDVTGIPNRRYLNNELERAIKNNIGKNSKVALVFIDLDNFKNINDTYGHDMGDAVLSKICEEFYKILEKQFVLARFGGDEFVIVMEDINDILEVKVVLDRILRKLKKAININGKDLYCALSIGVSIYPDDADKIDMLLKTADMAMYKAKANGKNRYEFFDVNMLNSFKREYEIEKALRDALELNEVYLVFQPKIVLTTGKIDGFEALVRWQSRELGFVSPGEFIPIAETSGIINELGLFIADESFKRAKELSLLTTEKFHVAINISEVQLRDGQFVNFVREKLHEYELSPNYIQFEITESIIMKSVSRNIDLLLKLKELGVTIALDDFGTGYSSLNYLRRLPIDVVKVDKSFVDGIGVDEKSEYIAESIIDLSHNLDLKVVAEGVETREQLGYLSKMSCDVVQGYYFSKPKDFELIKEMIVN